MEKKNKKSLATHWFLASAQMLGGACLRANFSPMQ
jgi:hypothetical protein